jgi:type IV secretory pathway TrbD component
VVEAVDQMLLQHQVLEVLEVVEMLTLILVLRIMEEHQGLLIWVVAVAVALAVAQDLLLEDQE